MTSKDILNDLAIQQQHEGLTDNIRMCYRVLEFVEMESQWQSLVSCKLHRYGQMSYEAHRFYYVRPWVIGFVECK